MGAMAEHPYPSFEQWLEYGVEKGWCSRDVCSTHDGVPSTEEEDALWEEGHDPCVHVLRLWPEGAKHE